MVSIITPTFNRAHSIEATLQSVKSQSTSSWECIIVDDGSTDATEDFMNNWVSKNARFRFFKRPKVMPKGPSSCRNYGVTKAKGDYVMFLDSDDFLAPDCVSNRLKRTAETPENKFWIFPMSTFRIKKEIQDFSKYINYTAASFLNAFVEMEFSWNVTAPLYRRAFIEGLGGFSEELCVFEDPELAVRSILASNGAFKFYNESDAYYKLAPVSEEKPIELKNILAYYQKIIALLTETEKQTASTWKAFLKIARASRITPNNKAEVQKIKELLVDEKSRSNKEMLGVSRLLWLNENYYKKPGYFWLKSSINKRYFS